MKTLPTVCVIGSQGRMGHSLGTRWRDAGYTVHGVDRVPEPEGPVLRQGDVANAVALADIVVLCVPVTALREVLALVVPTMRPEQLLMDVTSVKVRPVRWMEEAFAGPVIGTHPLFGPNPAPEALRTALVRGHGSTEAHAAWVEEMFHCFGCRTFWATAEEHDRGVALAQSLNFTVSAAFFATLAENEHVRDFLTPSFTRHLEAARKHLTQDTAMFCEFTGENPMFPEMVRQYREVLDRVAAGELADVAKEAAIWYGRG